MILCYLLQICSIKVYKYNILAKTIIYLIIYLFI